MTNKVFDTLRFLQTVLLPAIGTLYFALAGIWGESVFPAAEAVVGTVTALTAFLGAFVEYKRQTYNKGAEDDVE